jgi:twitching motility two-component system response regulator PilG
MQDVTARQQEWAALAPVVPSMDAVPKLSPRGLQGVKDTKAQQHLQQWVDGVRSLIDIAEQLSEDPLELARSYRTHLGSWRESRMTKKCPIRVA